MIARVKRLEAALTTAFGPTLLEVVDDSASHAGHSGAAPGGETHFTVRMVATRFEGQSRVARSRAVHDALASEFQNGLHALSLDLRTPAEQLRKDTAAV